MKNEQKNVDKRRQEILALVEDKQSILVEDLAETFGVSSMTVRRDLAYLSQRGDLIRKHGRALAHGSVETIPGIGEDVLACRKKIAAYAARFIADGDEIFMNGSRTALELLHYVGEKRVVVRTNNGYAMDEEFPENVQILLTGGNLFGKILVGEYVVQNLLNMSADKTFLGCAAVYEDGEFRYDIPTEIGINEMMISRTRGDLYVLADHTKLKKREGFQNVYGSFRYNYPVTLVTDEYSDREILQHLEDNGIKVIQVEG